MMNITTKSGKYIPRPNRHVRTAVQAGVSTRAKPGRVGGGIHAPPRPRVAIGGAHRGTMQLHAHVPRRGHAVRGFMTLPARHNCAYVHVRGHTHGNTMSLSMVIAGAHENLELLEQLAARAQLVPAGFRQPSASACQFEPQRCCRFHVHLAVVDDPWMACVIEHLVGCGMPVPMLEVVRLSTNAPTDYQLGASIMIDVPNQACGGLVRLRTALAALQAQGYISQCWGPTPHEAARGSPIWTSHHVKA